MIAVDQAKIFLIFIIVGILISFIFDMFRIVRKVYKFTDIMIYIQDVLFWILAGLILLFSIFKFNSGSIRLYLFFSVFIGAILYTCSISSIITNIGTGVLKVLNTILNYIIKILFIPIKVVHKIICKLKNKLSIIKNKKFISNNNKIKSAKHNIVSNKAGFCRKM